MQNVRLISLGLLWAGAAYAYEPRVQIAAEDRYTVRIVNRDEIPLSFHLPNGEMIVLGPEEWAMRHRSIARHAGVVEVHATAGNLRTRLDLMRAESEELQGRRAGLEAQRLTWRADADAEIDRLILDLVDVLSPLLPDETEVCLAVEVLRRRPPLEEFLTCAHSFGLSSATDVLVIAPYVASLAAINKAAQEPDFDLISKELAQDADELQASIAELTALLGAGDTALADSAIAATRRVELGRISFPKVDVTPYTTLAISLTPVKGVPPSDYAPGGAISWQAEVAFPLSPEIYLAGAEIAGLMRFMGTAAIDVTTFTLRDGDLTDNNAVRRAFTSLDLGAQLRTTLHPYAFFDLGAGLEFPMFSSTTTRVDGAAVASSGGTMDFESWGNHLGQKVWGQLRVGMNLRARRGLEHRGAGPSFFVATRVRQWPIEASPSSGMPEGGAIYPDLRVGISLNL